MHLIAVAYACGILLGKQFDFSVWLITSSFLVFCSIFAFALYQRASSTLILLVLVILAGLLSFRFSELRQENSGQHFHKEQTGPVFQFKQKFNDVLISILPAKEAALLGSILLGDDVTPLPEELKDDYRRAGLIHLLVVSGTQVSILIGLCASFTRMAGFPAWLAFLFTSCLNLFLVIVTGAGASIVRAAIMGEAALIGQLLERNSAIMNSLALAALILLAVNPACLFDIGFQLSFAATWSLA